MLYRDLLSDNSVIVRLKGVILNTQTCPEYVARLPWDKVLAKRTADGLLTVTSADPSRPSRTLGDNPFDDRRTRYAY